MRLDSRNKKENSGPDCGGTDRVSAAVPLRTGITTFEPLTSQNPRARSAVRRSGTMDQWVSL